MKACPVSGTAGLLCFSLPTGLEPTGKPAAPAERQTGPSENNTATQRAREREPRTGRRASKQKTRLDPSATRGSRRPPQVDSLLLSSPLTLLDRLMLPLQPFATSIPPLVDAFLAPTKSTTPAEAQQCRCAASFSFSFLFIWLSSKNEPDASEGVR